MVYNEIFHVHVLPQDVMIECLYFFIWSLLFISRWPTGTYLSHIGLSWQN